MDFENQTITQEVKFRQEQSRFGQTLTGVSIAKSFRQNCGL